MSSDLPIPNPLDRIYDHSRRYVMKLVEREIRAAARAGMRMLDEKRAEMQRLVDYTLSGKWLRDAQCYVFDSGGGSSHFCMDLSTFLQRMERVIKQAGDQYNIDARAIAGAIAWEYTQNNWRGRGSDYLQVPLLEHFEYELGNGVGWGSMHGDAIVDLYPDMTSEDMFHQRMDADSAIRLVAEIMGFRRDEYFERSGGIWIADNPPVLAQFFNSSRTSMLRSADKRKLSMCEPDKVVTLDISFNDMEKERK